MELPDAVSKHLARSQSLRQESDRAKHLAAQEVRVAAKDYASAG